MPELPDVVVYLERIAEKVAGATLEGMRFASPFVLRSYDPKPAELVGRAVIGTRRIGKRIVLAVDPNAQPLLDVPLFVVVHLMVAGRFRWSPVPREKIPGKVGLAAFDFSSGTLLLTEASTKKRASVHLVRGEEALAAMDPGGIEPLEVDFAAFHAALVRENHTLKRTLTDPRIFSGIGNAYSDEILHRAKLSPVRMTKNFPEADALVLFEATRATLTHWLELLRADLKDGWPDKVTAFRPEMAVHGKYGLPCPVCGSAVQRITYAENETNYCATCQTGGKLLADRSLSRLLKSDWPKTLEELEERRAPAKKP